MATSFPLRKVFRQTRCLSKPSKDAFAAAAAATAVLVSIYVTDHDYVFSKKSTRADDGDEYDAFTDADSLLTYSSEPNLFDSEHPVSALTNRFKREFASRWNETFAGWSKNNGNDRALSWRDLIDLESVGLGRTTTLPIVDVVDHQDERLLSNTTAVTSLAAHLVNDENCVSAKDFVINSTRGYPVENDLFQGNVFLLLRPSSPSSPPVRGSNDADFGTRFQILVQGRFKRVPEGGELYCGAEITDQIALTNSISRGLSKLLLRLLRKVVGVDMEYSFGGEKAASNDDERAHISFPISSAMDRIIVTEAGSVPPDPGELMSLPSGTEFEQRSTLDDDVGVREWNVDDTYTMSFSANCVDLTTWKIVSPCTVDLSNFWGKAFLRLVIYEKIRDDDGIDLKNYMLALQMRYLGESSRPPYPRHKEKAVDIV